MDNSVFYDIKLNWGSVKSGLSGMATSARQAFGSVDKEVSRTQYALETLSKPVNIKVNTGDITRAGRDIDGLKGKMESLGIGDIAVGNIAAHYGQRLIEKAVDIGKDMLKNGVEMQNTKVGLGVFTKDKDKADRIVEDIMKTSAMTPYTSQALLPGIRGIMSTDYSYKESKRAIMGLANAIAGSGGGNAELARTALEMQHAAASGRVQGQVLRELMMNNIPVIPMLQKSMPELKGLSKEKAYDKIEEMGGIKYDKLVDVLDKASQKGGIFEGAMAKLSQTIGGKWSTIQDYWQMGSAHLIEQFAPQFTQIEDRLINGIKKITDNANDFKPLVDWMVKATNTLIDLGKFLYENRNSVMSFFKVVKTGVEIWAGYKAAVFLAAGMETLYALKQKATIGGIWEMITARVRNDFAINTETASIEAQNIALSQNIGLMRTLSATNWTVSVSGAGLAAGSASGLAGSATSWGVTGLMGAGVVFAKLKNILGAAAFRAGGIGSLAALPFLSGDNIMTDEKKERNARMQRMADEYRIENLKKERDASIAGVTPGQKEAFGETIKKVSDWWNGTAAPWLKKALTTENDHIKKKATNADMIQGESENVIGGGKKITQFNFNAPLMKIDNQYFNEIKDAVNKMEPTMKEMLLRILAGVPA